MTGEQLGETKLFSTIKLSIKAKKRKLTKRVTPYFKIDTSDLKDRI